jgi:hypothetical protein
MKVWRTAIRAAIPAGILCRDSLEIAIKTFDYGNKMGLMCAMSILTQNIEKYQWPADWVEAIKERFLPHWALQKWPVRYRKIEVSAIYPKAMLPEPVFKAMEMMENRQATKGMK